MAIREFPAWISARVSESDKARLLAWCEAEGMSPSEGVRLAIRRALDEEDDQ